jgi:hypothetical protein
VWLLLLLLVMLLGGVCSINQKDLLDGCELYGYWQRLLLLVLLAALLS